MVGRLCPMGVTPSLSPPWGFPHKRPLQFGLKLCCVPCSRRGSGFFKFSACLTLLVGQTLAYFCLQVSLVTRSCSLIGAFPHGTVRVGAPTQRQCAVRLRARLPGLPRGRTMVRLHHFRLLRLRLREHHTLHRHLGEITFIGSSFCFRFHYILFCVWCSSLSVKK